MTTEEYEPELADKNPIELSRRVEISKRQLPPDMADIGAFYKRQGVNLSEEKSDEAPTEKKSYRLPTLEPMMSTWTYQAIRLEESPGPHEDTESEDSAAADIDEDENVDNSDDERLIDRQVQVS